MACSMRLDSGAIFRPLPTIWTPGTSYSQNRVHALWGAKKTIAAKDATHAVTKRKPENVLACRDSNRDLRDTGAML